MADALTTSASAESRAGDEPLVLEPSLARILLQPAALAALAVALSVVVGQWTGWRPTDASGAVTRILFGAIGAALAMAMFASRSRMQAIVVAGGRVAGPSGGRRVEFPLGELDRARLAADLASRWRRTFGIELRSCGGDAIRVAWPSFGRRDRELLLRTLGVAPGAGGTSSRPDAASA